MSFEYALFDFDGTLMDTSEGVFNSFDYVQKFYGTNIPRSEYDKMIGPPLKFSFKNFFKLPDEEIYNAVKKYREYYSVTGLFETRFYDGVIDLIEDLKKRGIKIMVATSKPEIYAKKILERFGKKDLFDFIGGSDEMEKGRVEKIDVIKYVIEENNLSDKKEKCLMIGDRYFDVNGAHTAGLKCAGILWGFGTQKEFEECGADYICEKPQDVLKLFSE